MDGDGFDVWGSQPSASGPATHAGLDLNSQAPVSDREFDACDADENYNPMPSSS
uniref:Uncharacterized protein n=1 Tax=Triticum urartu TaxID=4572 RepID=A0A8R7PWB2_TRIUA